jgi:hypothetical protein
LGDLNSLAKMLIVVGLFILVSGVILLLLGKLPHIGKLPGDIYVKKGNFTFYFPIATGILLSIILTLVLNLFFRR